MNLLGKKERRDCGVLSPTDVLRARLEIMRCPACKRGQLGFRDRDALICGDCNALFPAKNGIVYLIDSSTYGAHQKKMSAWWDDLCRQWYSDFDKTLTSERLYGLFDELEESYRDEDHLIFWMDLPSLKGKSVLDIGCGGGIHDCVFRRYGADVTAVDISSERAFSAGFKMSLVREGSGFAAQVNGENLPFKDNSFDIVYSNGVMHHSESTENMIKEARRVLRPGGVIVMMLYAKISSQYLIHLLYDGIFKGYIIRYGKKYWLGVATEGRPKFGTTPNPFTRAYTKREIEELLAHFRIWKLSKYGMNLSEIPFFGRRIRPVLCRLEGKKFYTDAMILRAGLPAHGGYLSVEKLLGRCLGWSYRIKAEKN